MAARETALNALIACRRQGAWSNGVLKEYILRDRLDRRDAALATRLCYGVLQNRLKLDFYLAQLLTGKVKDLHPVLRDILHLGLYQLYEMDRIPDAAAVNESVELAKKYCKKLKSGPGLVNAVLRQGIDRQGTLTRPRGWQEIYSHPQGLIDLLMAQVGKPAMEPMLRANNEIPPVVAQVNCLKTTTEDLGLMLQDRGIFAQPHPWMADCLILEGVGDLEQLPEFRQGLFYIQDAASKLSVLCAQLTPGRVLDCCAAPGGKSFAAAVAMGGRGEIISCDIHPHKVELIRRGAQRLGLAAIRAQVQDGEIFRPDWEGQMDTVLCDVPCSGYGIIRKKPDIRYKNPETMAQLPALQSRILANQARYVKPGGVLLYSTCTLLRRENEDVVAAFLQGHPDFSLEKLTLPQVFPENTSGMLTLIPGQYDTDGFFISRLRRVL